MDSQHIVAESWELLQRMIAIPSVSRNEKELADMLEPFLGEKGFTVNRLHNNIWIENGADETLPRVLLNSHIDTVKPVSGWSHDPFTPLVEGEKLTGLGANDAAASVVSLLAAFRILTEKKLPYRLVFLASAEEEISGVAGIESVLSTLGKFDLGIVGEPTQMQLAVAEKGLLVIDAEAIGVAGHAARNEGVNAIYKALDDIAAIRAFDFGQQSEWLGAVKATVTQIDAGTQHNVVPDCCKFVIDVRTTDCVKNEEAFAALKQVVTSHLVARSFRLNASGIDNNHPVVKCAQQMGIRLFGSPTLSDQALMSFPSVKIGPGDSARSHHANEYILRSEIEQAVTVYCQLLSNLEINIDIS